jgi:hypothetical protein
MDYQIRSETRFIYLVDAVHFVLFRVGAVNTVLYIYEQPLVLGEYIIVCRVLTSVALFSRVMESRDRRLCDVIPATREVLGEWRVIWDNSRRALKERYLMDRLSAHFSARIEMDALDAIFIAHALTPYGWAEVRHRERQYRDKRGSA